MSAGERTGSLSQRYGNDYDMTYAYDPTGNLAYEATDRTRIYGDMTHNISERNLLWDGMNRLKAVSENGNDNGERLPWYSRKTSTTLWNEARPRPIP